MSGPKSSHYSLAAYQRALLLEQQRLEREREIERQNLEREKARRNALVSAIQQNLSAIEKQMLRIDELLRESKRPAKDAEQLKASFEKIKSAMQTFKAQSPSTSANMKMLNDELRAENSKAKELFQSAESFLQALGESYHAELDEIIQKGFSLSFSGISERDKRENPHLKRINDILAGINPDIPLPLKEQFESIRTQAEAISKAEYLDNFCAVVVIPFAKTCRECERYDELMARYLLLAKEANIPAEHFECSAGGMQKILDASDKLEAIILEERERAYINEAFDSAMQEMGYELVGNRVVKKRSGKHVRHELYTLHEGIAIDVTYADNGQISMELGGVGHTDRQPTAAESEQLVEDMHSFCNDYALLEKKLAERGVMTEHISLLPPTAEYAQIFNSNDYSMIKPVTALHTEKGRRTEKQIMRNQ